jgi:tRNA/tmRNA/rRNA uracil-C5-methylase (TrmA/RlmC/RlmD family)
MNYRNSTTISYNNENNFNIMSPYIKAIYDYFAKYQQYIKNITIRHSNKYSLIKLYASDIPKIDIHDIIEIEKIKLKSFWINSSVIYGKEYFWYDFNVNNKLYKSIITPTNFFQINRFLFETLYNIIIQEFEPYQKYKLIGFGDDTPNIILPILKEYNIKELTMFVHYDTNIQNFYLNILKNKINISEFKGKLESNFEIDNNEYVLICNPGRKGLSKNVCEKINKSNIKTILYMSCKPTSFQRDMKILDTYMINKRYELDFFKGSDGYLETLHILHKNNI